MGIGGTMNNLNSVLLEGRLTKDAAITKDNQLHFTLLSQRMTKNSLDGFFFPVYLPKYTEALRDQLLKNKRVRIVGRLGQYEGTLRVIVVAEHIDIAPGQGE
jgi:hypothetical protein